DIEKAAAKQKEAAANVDQVSIEEIKLKMNSPTVAVNVRIIASAENEVTAGQILGDIESSFNQFENTHGNKLVFERVKKGDFKKLLYDFSFRLADDKYRILANLKELTSLIHFPAMVMKSSPHLKIAKAGSAPAPLDLPQEGVFLGTNTDRGRDTKVFLTPEDRLRHFYVIGQTGTGKTTLLKNMIVQDINEGRGLCFIDPHGSDVQDILALIPPERVDDVVYFDPAYVDRPMALNMLEYDRRFPEQKTFVVNEMLSIFNKLFDMKTAGGPMFEQYFRNAVLLTIDDPTTGSTLVDVSRVLSNKTFRDLKLSKCTNPLVVQFWTEVASKAGGEASLANIVPYIVSKFDNFLANDIMRPVIAQEKSSFNFREIMDSKKILLVNLSKGRLGDINANLIGLVLVGKILMAALSRVDSIGKDLPPFYLYIDEFQNITTDSIATILSEARKYKLSLNIAHQFIAQLDEKIKNAVFGNVGSLAVFRVGAEDAEYLEKQMAPVFTAKDIMNIDNYNAYMKMLAHGLPQKPFNIRVPAPEKGPADVADKLKEISYLMFGKPRAEVEAEIMAKYKKEEVKAPIKPVI
ncbi:MAG: TraM recognition domain-containing protein, partial [Candidatus Taylorbacteria bacterium]|nr:TraM recognition domain-containing protein [Candidatus Taylorbacteria bacterium]